MDFFPTKSIGFESDFLQKDVMEIKKNEHINSHVHSKEQNSEFLEVLALIGNRKENGNEIKKSPTSYEMMQNINEHLNQNNDQLTLKNPVNIFHKKTDDHSF